MSDFLRDRFIKNVSLNDSRMTALAGILTGIAETANAGVPEDDPRRVSLRYMIRFDNKGFLVDDINAMLEYHRNAKRTERLHFFFHSYLFRSTNGLKGMSVDLRLDALNDSNCALTVQHDEADWVDAVFCRIDEELRKYGNMNFLFRTRWTPLLVQILGLVFGFSLSLWAALRISPALNVEYAFILSFVLAFLIFSNVWTYMNAQILLLVNYLFPNVVFEDVRGFKWLGRTFIGAVVVATAFYLIDASLQFLGGLLDQIIR